MGRSAAAILLVVIGILKLLGSKGDGLYVGGKPQPKRFSRAFHILTGLVCIIIGLLLLIYRTA